MLYDIKQTLMIRSARKSAGLDKRSRSLFLTVLIFLLVASISISLPHSAVSSVVISITLIQDADFMALLSDPSTTSEQMAEAMLSLAESIPSWAYVPVIAASGLAALFAILYCKLFEKRRAFSIGFNKRGFFSEYLGGLIIGAVMISLPALACHLSKGIVFSRVIAPNALAILGFFAAFILQALGEEALFRGYLLTSIARRYPIWVAIIGSSSIFAFFHTSNQSFSFIAFTNLLLFGIFASLIMLKRGSIWMSAAIHAAWNFVQGNVFGINVSGNPKFDSIFTSELGKIGKILSGGEFGLEGGLGVTIILLIGILMALLSETKKCEIAPVETEEEGKNGEERPEQSATA